MIRKLLIGSNYSSRGGDAIKYIVVHDTGNPRAGADAINHYRYFNGPGRNVSCHYVVDGLGIIQLVEDRHSAWHCGDGKGRFGIKNSNSIGIEMCINEDGNRDLAKKYVIELIRYLLVVHDLKKDSIVRHFDASLKLCPKSMMEMGWREWTLFYNEI